MFLLLFDATIMLKQSVRCAEKCEPLKYHLHKTFLENDLAAPQRQKDNLLLMFALVQRVAAITVSPAAAADDGECMWEKHQTKEKLSRKRLRSTSE